MADGTDLFGSFVISFKVCQVDYVHLEADLKVFVTLIIA